MRRIAGRLVPGLFAVLLVVSSPHISSIHGGEAPPEGEVSIVTLDVGFQGAYKVGDWTPLWVTLLSSIDRQVEIVVDVPDPDDNLTSLPFRSVELKSRFPAHVETGFRMGRLHGELHVRVQDPAGRTLASRRLRAGKAADAELRPAYRLDRPLWIALGNLNLAEGSSPDEVVRANPDSVNPDSAREPLIVSMKSLTTLPADWRLLHAVDLVILATGRTGGDGSSLLDQVTPEVDAVLQKWVRGGGHLLISVGSESAAFQASPLATWMKPIVVEGPMPLRQLSSLEAFAGQNSPLTFQGTLIGASLGRLPTANMVVRQTGKPQPLVASVPCGFGRLTVVGVDIDAPPLSNWTALKAVLAKLANSNSHAGARGARKLNQQLTHVGVSDLATQFEQTHEDFPAVRRPSYWWVMGLILLYVAVIGPLDYLLVHRVLRRPELTWLTLPLLAGAAFALAAWDADRTNNQDLMLNQFDLIDMDASSGTVRGRTWVSLYSPEHRRYSVEVEPTMVWGSLGSQARVHRRPEVQMSWSAAPENAVGGLYRSGTASFGGRGYRFAPGAAQVENIPVAQWSTRNLCAAWNDDLPRPVVDCRLETSGAGQLKGTITHDLAVPLQDCLLVVGGWAYIPANPEATLKPRVAWRPSGDAVRQRDLKALLTGEQQARRNKNDKFDSEIISTTEIYDPLNRDRRQQVRMLSFFEVAGGTEYTGLAHAALHDLELTEIMQLGRGVLIGRIPFPAARVVVDGKPVQPAENETWVRLVFPIQQSDRAVERMIPKLNDQLPPIPQPGKAP